MARSRKRRIANRARTRPPGSRNDVLNGIVNGEGTRTLTLRPMRYGRFNVMTRDSSFNEMIGDGSFDVMIGYGRFSVMTASRKSSCVGTKVPAWKVPALASSVMTDRCQA